MGRQAARLSSEHCETFRVLWLVCLRRRGQTLVDPPSTTDNLQRVAADLSGHPGAVFGLTVVARILKNAPGFWLVSGSWFRASRS